MLYELEAVRNGTRQLYTLISAVLDVLNRRAWNTSTSWRHHRTWLSRWASVAETDWAGLESLATQMCGLGAVTCRGGAVCQIRVTNAMGYLLQPRRFRLVWRGPLQAFRRADVVRTALR